MSEDPRVLRTRDRLRAAALRALADDPGPPTMIAIAAAAEVNRSTAHQHYDDLAELIGDAIAADLTQSLDALADCPLLEPRDRPPKALAVACASLRDRAEMIDRLSPGERAAVLVRLIDALSLLLLKRFRAGRRPPGHDLVRPEHQARFIAGGLIAVILDPHTSDSPVRLASQSWRLIRPGS